MSDGRTFWWAKDATWYEREAIVLLGEEFGAEGTTVIDVLSCQAKLENHGGRVKTGYASLTRRGNIKSGEKTTRAIVARAVELGALDDFSEDRLTFTARVSGWESDQSLASSAERMRRHRQKQRDVTSPLRDVTTSCLTEQDSTEQKEVNSNVEPRLDAQAEQARQLFADWQERCGHPNARPTRERLRKIQARLSEGYTPEQVRSAIDGAARAAFVNETGKRFDDIELICRSGSKLEGFIERATASGAASGRQSRRDQVISDRGDYLKYYDDEGSVA